MARWWFGKWGPRPRGEDCHSEAETGSTTSSTRNSVASTVISTTSHSSRDDFSYGSVRSQNDEGGGCLMREAAASPSGPPVRRRSWMLGKQYSIVEGSIYFMSLRSEEKLMALIEWHERSGLDSDRVFLCIDKELVYFPFCADFGPLCIGSLYKFREIMAEYMQQQALDGKKIVLYTGPEQMTRTNAACLLASWLVLERGFSPQAAWAPFQFEGKDPFVPFRDASFDPVTFPLYIIDILEGLHRAKWCGILDLDHFDHELYEYLDHPLTGDLHVVVPGVFAALRGPKSAGATKQARDEGVYTAICPEKYLEIFEMINVTDVVRLNSRQYDRSVFTDAGLAHHELFFDDCTTPSASVLARWFKICRERKGMIAVHCKAGLGRTGTLICAWLMRKYMFTARQAIGYLRVIRPGSVLGQQQEFLEENEQLFWELGDPDLNEEDQLLDMCADGRAENPVDLGRNVEADQRDVSRRVAENTAAMNKRAEQRMDAMACRNASAF